MHAAPNHWLTISIGLMGLIVGYAVGTTTQTISAVNTLPQQLAQNPSQPTPPSQPPASPPQTGVGPTLGESSAPITFIEFTDFQCPYCSRHFAETYGNIKTAYVDTGKVKYELRHFPLTSIHPNAKIAAEAAMCADKQGKFWQMHDKLFESQAEWANQTDPTATLKTYAADLDVEQTAFDACLDNHETRSIIQKDVADGGAAGITGTPGFWIIGPKGQTQHISGAYPYETFQTAFETMLAE